jgi:hydroxypyruvate isomerase
VTRRAVNVSILHPDVPVLERAGRTRRDGWTAIESWDRWVDALEHAGYRGWVALEHR